MGRPIVMRTYSEQIADWLAALRPGDIPSQLVEDAKLRILDTVGLMVAGATTRTGAAMHEAARAMGPGADAHILGFGERAAAPIAALANGTLANSLSFDDTHTPSLVHTSATTVPTAFTVGEWAGASGREVIAAVIGGNELNCRLGMVAPVKLYQRGFHPTAVFGAFAATAAAGRLLGLTGGALAHAFGVAGSQAAGLLEAFADGNLTKTLHTGWAAHVGVLAATLARSGFTGPRTVFEGRFGLMKAHAPDQTEFDFDALTRGLGAEWEILRASFKPYPSAHPTHGFIDAALRLRRDEGLRPENVERIILRVAPIFMQIICDPRSAKVRPRTPEQAVSSVYFAVAAALRFGTVGFEAFDERAIADPEILALAERIVVEPDPSPPAKSQFKGWIIAETKDGRRLERIQEHSWGTPGNPMGADDIDEKFRRNASLALGKDRVDAIVAAAERLEDVEDIGAFVRLCLP